MVYERVGSTNSDTYQGATSFEDDAIDLEVDTTEDEKDDEYYRSRFGLALEEANIPVRYRNYSGCLGQMLTDKECPLSDEFEELFAEAEARKQGSGRKAVKSRLVEYQDFFKGDFKLGEDGNLRAEDLPEDPPPPPETKSEPKKKLS